MEEEIPQKSKTEIEDRIHFLKDREAVLRKDYDKCIAWRVRVVFYSFYVILQYFTACTLLSVPIGIYMKRYTPLFAGGIIGSAADAWEAKVKCGKMADEVVLVFSFYFIA